MIAKEGVWTEEQAGMAVGGLESGRVGAWRAAEMGGVVQIPPADTRDVQGAAGFEVFNLRFRVER